MKSGDGGGDAEADREEDPSLGQHQRLFGASFAERHYRISELAELWGWARETVRKLVKDDPGVIKISQERKKADTTYSVPESAAHSIHNRLLNIA